MFDTLDDLLDRLSELPENLPLTFASPDGSFGTGYQITEFHLARIAAIDCGGGLSARAEAVLQLRNGSDGHVITAQKLTRIAQRSRGRVPGLDAAPCGWRGGAWEQRSDALSDRLCHRSADPGRHFACGRRGAMPAVDAKRVLRRADGLLRLTLFRSGFAF